LNSLVYKTISANAATVDKQWVVIDVKNIPLGRACSIIANFLRGKYKTNYTPHVDCGDNVIVLNAAKIKLTGNKWEQKKIHPPYRLSWRPTCVKSYSNT
jgi:large subunit ribosomal protein L13